MGHAAPFAVEDGYRPAPGIERWLSGTPAILGLAGLEAGVDLALEADMAALEAKSAALFDVLAAAGDAIGLACVSPRGSEEHTSELQSLMRNSYAVFCLKKKQQKL